MRLPFTTRRSRPERTRGQSMVEFALVLPVMLVLLAGAIDLGRLFYAYVAVENAAKEGALFGARSPLCDDALNLNCGDPNNVKWHVANEAPNLGSQFTTVVACRDGAGTLMQPINNCLDGHNYIVNVSYAFTPITPIISSLVGQTVTLSSESQATVISDAFDPTGLEVLVWVNNTGADNGATIALACTQADSTSSPNFYYQPCQDTLNVDTYLQFPENATVSYKVRVRNTGNINLTSLTYGFTANGTSIGVPGTCGSLPTSLASGASPAYCTFTRTAPAAASVTGLSDYIVAMTAQGIAQSIATGQTNGAASIKVIPVPRLAVNLRAAPYRLGGNGNGTAGAATYSTSDLDLNLNPLSPVDEIRNPTGWLYLTVVNQGGQANNFGVSVTQQGVGISLPSQCVVPAALGAAGQSGDTFVCIFPRTFNSLPLAYGLSASASATNALIVGGQHPNVAITTRLCADLTDKVIPNLVNVVDPSPDGSSKTVGQAQGTWAGAGMTGSFSTIPGGAAGGATVLTQDQTAYTCVPANTDVTVGAQ